MKQINMNFIPQNVAPLRTRKIVVYDSVGNKVGVVPLGRLSSNYLGYKLYSFGCLSDVHVQYNTGREDFQRALTYLDKTEGVDFTCICGDLTVNGTVSELTEYKKYVDAYSPNTPVYAIAGNHDASHTSNWTPVTLTYDGITPYTGYPLYYTFTQGNDIFVMIGQRRWDAYNGNNSDPFSTEELQWLYETLEANRNKRCFVFQHLMRLDGAGNPYNLYTWDGLNNTQGKVFKSLVSHYKNVIWFHGHSHTKFDTQNKTPIANYDRLFGCHSIHIPSLAVPRGVTNEGYERFYEESEGYVVDVYENGIHLRGRDFVAEKFVPIASYWLDTAPVEIAANTYSDPTGTIVI